MISAFQYTIEEDSIRVFGNGTELELPISVDLGQLVKQKIQEESKFTPNVLFITVTILFFCVAFGGVMGVKATAIIATIILLSGIGIWGMHRFMMEEALKNLMLDLEGNYQYLIRKESVNTIDLIASEEGRLQQLLDAKAKAESHLDNDLFPEFKSEEKQGYQEAIKHLDLRINLRRTKIEFFEKYLSRIKLYQAINIAEDAILSDFDQEEGGLNTSLNYKKVQEDILVLKPLSDQMRLCESELLAQQLIVELNEKTN